MNTIINQTINKLETIVDTSINLIETSILTNPVSINVEVNDGRVGASAYEIAVLNGFVGTEQDWLNSLGNGPIYEADIIDLDKYTKSEVDNFLDDKLDNPIGNNTQYLDGAGTPTTFPTIPSGITNIGYTPSPTNGIITSNTGTDATIPLADGTNAGLVKPSKYILLESITEAFTTALKITYDDASAWVTNVGLQLKTDFDSLLATGTRLITNAEITKLSNTSGTNTGDNTVNTTSNTYADGKVVNTLTNGDTTHSPSSDIVFDALALKADATSIPITTAWTNATLLNAWVVYNVGTFVQYRKIGDVVEVRGLVKSGTTGTTIFTLPVGFRPPGASSAMLPCIANGLIARLDVSNNGNVSISTGNGNAYLSLDIIRFSTI